MAFLQEIIMSLPGKKSFTWYMKYIVECHFFIVSKKLLSAFVQLLHLKSSTICKRPLKYCIIDTNPIRRHFFKLTELNNRTRMPNVCGKGSQPLSWSYLRATNANITVRFIRNFHSVYIIYK